LGILANGPTYGTSKNTTWMARAKVDMDYGIDYALLDPIP
jgi:hypothetical protein